MVSRPIIIRISTRWCNNSSYISCDNRQATKRATTTTRPRGSCELAVGSIAFTRASSENCAMIALSYHRQRRSTSPCSRITSTGGDVRESQSVAPPWPHPFYIVAFPFASLIAFPFASLLTRHVGLRTSTVVMAFQCDALALVAETKNVEDAPDANRQVSNIALTSGSSLLKFGYTTMPNGNRSSRREQENSAQRFRLEQQHTSRTLATPRHHTSFQIVNGFDIAVVDAIALKTLCKLLKQWPGLE